MPERRDIIQAVERALRIASVILTSPRALALGEISALTDLNKATALRLLRTLMAERLVLQDPDSGYYARSPEAWIVLSPHLRPAYALVQETEALLKELAREADGTAMIVYPDAVMRRTDIPLFAFPPSALYLDPAGQAPPLHACAAGKCYLASLSEAAVSYYLSHNLTKATLDTHVDAHELRHELDLVRRKGFATNCAESIEGTCGLSVPLHDPCGLTVAGISLAWRSSKLPKQAVTHSLPLLQKTTPAIENMFTLEWWKEKDALLSAGALPPAAFIEPDDPSFGTSATPVVRSVARALRVYSLLIRHAEGLTITEIARARQIDRTTAHRLVLTLQATGRVCRDEATGCYRINPVSWLRLADIIRVSTSLVGAVTWVLSSLAHATGVTAIMAGPDHPKRKLVAYRYAVPDTPVHYQPGSDPPAPLHTLAGGKCYLAAQSRLWLNHYLAEGLARISKNTIVDQEALEAELQRVREQGFAVNRNESYAGMGGLAVPLQDRTGKAIGAVALAPPIEALTNEAIERWLPLLRTAADTLTGLLMLHGNESLARSSS